MPPPRRLPSLLGLFLVVSAVILACGAIVLGAALDRALYDQSVGQARRVAEGYVDRVLRPSVVRDGRVLTRVRVPAAARRELAHHGAEVLGVKVWSGDGTLVWTQIDPHRIGQRYPVGQELRSVLDRGAAIASFVHGDSPDDRAEQIQQLRIPKARLLEVYTPVRGPRGRPIGAYEVYVDAHAALDEIAAGRRLIWGVTAAVFVVLWGALALLVRKTSRRLRRQALLLRERSAALAEAYGALEQRSLEGIESLNATIEARDPSGAGRSAQVQRLALVLGRELELPAADLEALSLAARLHGIGNIAVPDAVLVKPGPLTAAEYEQVKLHAEEGAEILEHFSPLTDVVPIVRHHHERWDGTGYPSGLVAHQIPVGAAIVAVAEAWTAMTSDRPYRWGLMPEDTVAELVAGRGRQFSPAVVDALLRVVAERSTRAAL